LIIGLSLVLIVENVLGPLALVVLLLLKSKVYFLL